MEPRRAACLPAVLGLLLAVVATVGCGSDSDERGDSGPAQGPRMTGKHGDSGAPRTTRVNFAAPVDRAGRRLPGIRVASKRSGMCNPSSGLIIGPVYNCRYGQLADPCWAVKTRTSDPAVLCMARPWSRDVTMVITRRLPRVSAGIKRERGFPWGVELVSGERCIAHTGTPDLHEGREVRYVCRGGTLGLLGGFRQADRLWQADTVRRAGLGYRAGPPTGISVAWFVAPQGVNR